MLRQAVTHLIVCGDARSSKCLLAAAAGAELVTTEWLQACAAQGSWLPAAAYLDSVCRRPVCVHGLFQLALAFNSGHQRNPGGKKERLLACFCRLCLTQWLVQGPLTEAAAFATAWRVLPETAPLHGVSVYVAAASGSPRGKVVTALVSRLGGALTAASKCDVCVLCAQGVGKRQQAASKPRCKADAVFVADTWVIEAVTAASRPDMADHAL